MLNLFKSINCKYIIHHCVNCTNEFEYCESVNNGDGIDYSQQKGTNLGDLVQETLEVLEKSGGSAAFVLIKNMVPTYESCVWK